MNLNEFYLSQISDVMKLMYNRKLVQIRGGNASIIDRINNLIYISPTGVPRHKITNNDVSVIDINGKVIVGLPSSEWRMHLSIYKNVENAKGIVHAHPPYLLALNRKGLKLDLNYLTETSLRVKCLQEIPLINPGTEELANAVGEAAKMGCNAIILDNHGIVSYSNESIYHALEIVEAIEDLALIELYGT
ncbi:MAG: class II aldolase/adducin family protein [Caldisphaera sp.]|jgi:Ribulose-5-phosphate 4-epimerase and related epimerases and aldolases